MTDTKLTKYLEKTPSSPTGRKSHIPVVLADSTGKRLKKKVALKTDTNSNSGQSQEDNAKKDING